MTEKLSFGKESNHMPLTFWASALTTRPLRQPISHCPFIQGLMSLCSLDHQLWPSFFY